MSVLEVTNETFWKELETDLPVIVDYYTTWCGPCKSLAPVLEELSEKYEGTVKILKIDVGENQLVASHFHITSVPYIGIFQNKELVQDLLGFSSKTRDKLESIFEELLGN